ncbi:winged helix-turn-helix domain-containing protein [Vibrio sp. ZSDE26]|uniref:Winged helix-turn-helix domain-containing protein n=1 Tax=Vibrio amylolyticus TaxID=2847292 RepID=A0A9X1XJF2_9VIBR|nr:winged helix-turn-helix domain-containing protein [Vibrio amylolyticus]MCK6262938.1 winged helix-turn-helix domain-containing protein [Vibrio amylolyticus]
MTQPALEPPIYQVAGFQYSPTSGAIKNQEDKIIRLRAREANLLTALIDSFPEVLSRQSIEDQLWKGSYATNATINQTIKALRFSLEDDQRALIRTIPKQGYVLSSKPHLISEESELVVIQPAPKAEHVEAPLIEKTRLRLSTMFSPLHVGAIAISCLLFFSIGYQGELFPENDRVSHKVGKNWILFKPEPGELEQLKLDSKHPSIISKIKTYHRICQVTEGLTQCKNQ